MKKTLILIFSVFISSFGFASEPTLSEVLYWKHGYCMDTKQADINDRSENPKMIISSWKCSDIQPDESQIDNDFLEYKQHLITNKTKEDKDKSDLKAKLKLSDAEIKTIAKLVREQL